MQIKPGISKEEFHAILGPAQLHDEDKTSRGLAQELIKRERDFVYLMSVHFDQNERFKGGSFHSVPALLSSSYTPSKVPLKIPAGVARETERQIQFYLGTVDRKGIPLLDSSIDWTDLRHWPDQLELGEERLTSYASETSYDFTRYVGSKMELTHPNSVSLRYWKPPNGPHFRTGPYAYWSRSMQIYEQGFRWNGKSVFHYAFYSNGRLKTFERHDYVSGAHHSDVFNENGKLMGQVRGGIHSWKQKQVIQDEYYNRMFKMWGIKREP